MRAAVYTTTGSPEDDVLQVVSLPIPVAGAGQVVVKAVATSLNPIDVKVMSGALKDFGFAMPFPFTPGYDISGVVTEVGSGVDSFAVGDEVWCCNWGKGPSHDSPDDPQSTIAGCCAEYVLLKASRLSRKPKAVSHDLCAAVALTGTTAHEALFHSLKLTEKQRVLILGGSSAVGQIAVQLAKNRGLWVATTCSARTADFVKSLGADLVIDYTSQDWAAVESLKGVDAVFDAVGDKDGFERAKTVLKNDGGFLSINSPEAGFDPTAHPPLSFAAMTMLFNDPKVQDDLTTLLANGTLKIPIEDTFKLTQEGIVALFAKQAAGKSIGKNILKFD